MTASPLPHNVHASKQEIYFFTRANQGFGHLTMAAGIWSLVSSIFSILAQTFEKSSLERVDWNKSLVIGMLAGIMFYIPMIYFKRQLLIREQGLLEAARPRATRQNLDQESTPEARRQLTGIDKKFLESATYFHATTQSGVDSIISEEKINPSTNPHSPTMGYTCIAMGSPSFINEYVFAFDKKIYNTSFVQILSGDISSWKTSSPIIISPNNVRYIIVPDHDADYQLPSSSCLTMSAREIPVITKIEYLRIMGQDGATAVREPGDPQMTAELQELSIQFDELRSLAADAAEMAGVQEPTATPVRRKTRTREPVLA